jgi:type I restriction enzyme S subunit
VRNGLSLQQNEHAGGLPITRIETIADAKIDPTRVGFADLTPEDAGKHLLTSGDILLSHINSLPHIGKCAIYLGEPDQLVHGMNLLRLHPDPQHVDPKYLLYSLRTPEFNRKLLSVTNKSVNQASVSTTNLKELTIPLPPLAEQCRIAAILDKTDALRQQRRAALTRLDDLLQSIFLDMFGDPVTNPKRWEVKTLEEICGQKGQYGSGASSTVLDLQKPRYVRITDIQTDGSLTENAVSPSTDQGDWYKYKLVEGDIIFARSGATVGKTYLYKTRDGYCIYAGYLIRFRPLKEVMHSEFLFQFTRTKAYESWVASQQRAVAQPNINAAQYGTKLLVPVPPLELQDEFVKNAQHIEQYKQHANHFADRADNLFHSLQLRAFRGEL